MESNFVSRLTLLAILATSVFNSCKMPNDSKPIYDTHYALNVVRADGSSHWTLADGGSGPVPIDSGVIFVGDKGLLFIVKYDGSNLTQLYPGHLWDDHTLSPNGDKVLLGSGSFEKDGYMKEMYLMDPNGTNLVKLGLEKGWYAWTRISPDLNEILFFRDSGIATINANGTNFQYIKTKTDSTSVTLSLYIDQTHIVYFEDSNKGDTRSIRLLNKTNREDKLMAVYSSGFPVYGRAVVGPNLLLSGVDGIRIFNVYTSSYQQIGQGWSVSFSSDGSRIVGVQGKNIFTMNSDGSNVQTIYTEMDPTKGIIFPQFSPDDRYVVFQTSWAVTTN